jgi:hypothetical protein
MQEVAPFNLGVTIVEPGGARTEFRFGSAELGPQMDASKGTSAGMTRRILQDTSRLPPGDPAKTVQITIDGVDQKPAPKRIPLGRDVCAAIHKALTERLAALEVQKELAFSTDLPASGGRGAAAPCQSTAVPRQRWILRLAHERQADMIVLGMHGRTGTRKEEQV